MRVPFRHFRQLLSLHAAVAPDQPFLIVHNRAGGRAACTFAEFNARVHQAASFFYDDLGLRRGGALGLVAGDDDLDAAVIACAGLLLGAVVIPLDALDPDAAARALRDNSASVLFRSTSAAASASGAMATTIGFGGAETDFTREIANRPDTFMSTEERPSLDDIALTVYDGDTRIRLTQGQLLATADAVIAAHAITGNQRVLSTLSLSEASGFVLSLLTPLYGGGTTVLSRSKPPRAPALWSRLASEEVHVAFVGPRDLEDCLRYADEQDATGGAIRGEAVAWHHLRRLRHLTVINAPVGSLVRTFEDRFAVPVLTGYGCTPMAGLCSLMPIDMKWAQRRRWLRDDLHNAGIPVESVDMAVFDAANQPLGAGVRGALAVRWREGAESWQATGALGFYEPDERGRPFFFIT